MLSDNITLADASAANKTFNLVSQTGSERKRFDIASTLSAPRTMLVRHAVTGTGTDKSDRHSVSFQKIAVGADANPKTILASFSLVIPQDTSVAAQIDDLVAFVKNFLATSANIDAIKRGES